MTWLSVILLAYIAIAGLYWLAMLHCSIRMLTIRRLERLSPADPQEWPRLSVIVPACDEADQIGQAAKSLLDQDYPDLEVVVIDDRSTDSTGAIIDDLAAWDARLKAIHVKTLPEGWLGKIHAMKQGLDASTGRYVLFTDADVHYKPGTLRKAMAHILANNLDHLAALPIVWPTNILLDAIITSFLRLFLLCVRPWKAGKPRSKAFIGIGAFNMVRRDALDATAGLEWLKMETADDMALGQMMKKSGAKCGLVLAFKDIGLWWYKTVGQAMRGAEKAYSVRIGYSLWRAVPLTLFVLLCDLAPLLLPFAFFLPIWPWVGLAGLGVTVAYLVSALTLACMVPHIPLSELLSPFGSIFLAFGSIRSVILGRRRGGAVWRGVLYPEQALRDGKRIRM
ncbi:MAG: glycosyltransferase [Planctomycetes bacterium]|nr:glycosyltransferase [Planctomycetota bacterium]